MYQIFQSMGGEFKLCRPIPSMKILLIISCYLMTPLEYATTPYLTKALSTVSITKSFVNSSGVTLITLLTKWVVVVTNGTLITLSPSMRRLTATLSCFGITSYISVNHSITFTFTVLTAKNWVMTISALQTQLAVGTNSVLWTIAGTCVFITEHTAAFCGLKGKNIMKQPNLALLQ